MTVPCDKQPIKEGHAYVAPANYHMLVERNKTVSLSVDGKINWSRPSIDVLFESAAYVYGERLVAVILSGASGDGAEGMRIVKEYGGITVAQSPESAEFPVMQQTAIQACRPDYIPKAADIVRLLMKFTVDPSVRRSSND